MTDGDSPAPDEEKPADQSKDPENAASSSSTSTPGEEQVEGREDIESRARQRHDTYYTFVGSFDSEFVDSVRGRRHRAGIVDEQDVQAAMRFFCEPPRYRNAVKKLVMSRLVVLAGAEDTGRRCSAINLLSRRHCPGVDRDRPIEVLEPDTPLKALLDRAFVRGRRYLHAHYSAANGPGPGQVAFEIKELQQRVARAGAYLVLTTVAQAELFENLAVEWQPTTAADVFHCASVEIETNDPDLTADLDLVLGGLRLGQVTEFIDAVTRLGIADACAPYLGKERADLCTWLREGPGLPDVVPIVVAAALPGISETEHERRADALRRRIEEYADRDRAKADYSLELRPSRAGRTKVIRRPRRSGGNGIELIDGLLPEPVFAELHECYGDELWGPLRAWLLDQPDGSGYDVDKALAIGVSALLRIDAGLAEGVLDEWSASRTDGDRWVAALVNSEQCAVAGRFGRARQRAIRWSRGTQQQRITSTHTLSLNLSVLVPVEAICRLWNLAYGDAVVAHWARAELMEVARRATASPERLRKLLAVVEHQLGHVLDAANEHPELVDRALVSTSRILTLRAVGDVPLTVHALLGDAASAARLGRLWAQLVRSWSHRGDALDELHVVRLQLGDEALTGLGEALHDELSTDEWDWLCRDLGADLRRYHIKEVIR